MYCATFRHHYLLLHLIQLEFLNVHGTIRLSLIRSLQGPVNMNYSTGTVRRVLHDSLNVWAKNSKLTFREVKGDDADILVSFVR